MQKVPTDPTFTGTNKDYVYVNVNDQSYYLYAELESSDKTEDGMQACTYIGSAGNEYDYRYPAY